MFDANKCKSRANRLYLNQSRGLGPTGFTRKFRDDLDRAGRWFVNNGFAELSEDGSLGWVPRPVLVKITDALIETNALPEKVMGKKIRKALAEQESTRHFAIWLGLSLRRRCWSLIRDPSLEISLSIH